MSIFSRTVDSFQNFAARIGLGAGSQHDHARYGFDFISRNRVQLEAMYRSSWVVGQAVDVVAEDMTREGVEIKGDIPPADIEKINKALERMRIWDEICNTIKWARLYGGCLAVMLVDGQNPSTPLKIDSISKGQFKGLLVLDRWLVQPTLQDLVTEYGPGFGMPKYYDVVADSLGLSNQRIHHSRVIRIDGVDLPYWQRTAENLWGQSVIERLLDRLTAFDSTTAGTAQLVYKAHLRTYKVKDLRNIIATGGKAFEGLVKQIEHIRLWQSNEGMTLMDAEDQFEAHQYGFSGLSDVLLQFGQQLSGALQIPLVRLFGQSPAGLNSTGESDLRTYYDNIAQQQERRLRSPFTTLLNVVSMSELGKVLPDSASFDFTPLWQLNATEKATYSSSVTTSVLTAEEAGLISRATALKELRQSSEITGIWSNITDEDIAEAEEEGPPAPSDKPDPTMDAGNFSESDHPRDDDGKFSSEGGGASSSTVEITNEHIDGMPADLTDTPKLKEFLLEKLRDKPVVNKATGGKIIFTRNGIESSLKNRNPLARKMYLALPELLEQAKPMGSEDNHKEHKDGRIDRYDLYHATASMDGEKYEVTIKVEVPVRSENDRWAKDDRYYYHSIQGVKKIG